MIQTPTSSTWFDAEVAQIRDESPVAKTLTLKLLHKIQHLAGQHYELRLTSPDGYQAARLYSAASIPVGNDLLELTILNLPDGEISPYLNEQLKQGDKIEVRGPLGRFFVWDPVDDRPVLLVAGGSGVVPMRAILLAHKAARSQTAMHLLYSVRTIEDILYKKELLNNPDVSITITDEQSESWKGLTGRINKDMVKEVLTKLPENPICYVCGMTSFVEAAIGLLMQSGIPPASIKAERFGA